MSNDNDEKKDLTRIENLGEFLHDEDEDFSDLETYTPESPGSDEDMGDLPTDPNIEFPPEFKATPDDDDSEDEAPSFSSESSDNETSAFSQYGDEQEDDSPPEFSADEDQENFEESDSFQESQDFDSESNFESDENFDSGATFDSDEAFESDEAFDSDSSFDSEEGFEQDATFDNDENDDSNHANFDSDHDDRDSSFESDEDSFSSESDEDSLEENNHFSEDQNFDSEDNFSESNSLDDEQEEMANEHNDFASEFESEDSGSGPVLESKTIHETYSPPASEEISTPQASSSKETISQLQNFAKNVSYGDLTAEGNPPFSIVIKNVKYKEDIDDILSLLGELKIIEDPEGPRASLERGSMLIPRLSEYAAIIICHKLRRFHLDLLMGLTDEIQPPKVKESATISKSAVYGDYSHSFELSKGHIKTNDVMTATTTTLEGYEILQYLGVVSERTVIDMEHFATDQSLELELLNQLHDTQRDEILKNNIKRQNKVAANSYPVDYMPDPSEDKQEVERVTLSEIYQDLAYKLKAHAITFKGNAVVGINYQVTPILVSESLGIQSKYQISCTGSVVWAVKK